jgi:UDP-N-acetylglucosamine 2-epimerase (non-hydrolysing)
MKIAIILGTRPEIIKMSPIIRELDKRGLDYFILHTGQHYDYEMDGKLFKDLELARPKYNLKTGSSEYRKQIGLMIRKIYQLLKKESPDYVIVQGDTNTVLAGALAANKLGIKICHHEAGLRSHDLTMLEETNRIITDHISDLLFAPTEDAMKNLVDENLGGKDKTFLTGNTIVDALFDNAELARKKGKMLKELKIKKGGYILVTAHRAENVDDSKRLGGILEGLKLIGSHLKIPVIFPMHPRTANSVKKFGLKIPFGVRVIKPLGYLDFLQLESSAKLIITDSGGLQEEACILKIPCVTVRDNTERPETIMAGVNVLAGTDPERIFDCCRSILKKKKKWSNPYGDGRAGKRIIDIFISRHEKIT